MSQPVYILGTGLSHDGSSCILKDGSIAVAIEKERLTRVKHDGGNDRLTVRYCLDALGITLNDISLIVQVANFEKDEIQPDRFLGSRLYVPGIPVQTISHHLAHAYSAIATSPFREANVLVIDGAGSPAPHCEDWPNEEDRHYWLKQPGFYCEKDSFYHFDGASLHCLHKDFSEMRLFRQQQDMVMHMPTNYHSIGGVYSAGSNYCFGNMDDAGKLMGLAPYGKNIYQEQIFGLSEGVVTVRHEVFSRLDNPTQGYPHFKEHFAHYANVARWIQEETEKAVSYIAAQRMALYPHANLCYAGGVALNAVCNAAIKKQNLAEGLYMQPAAGDNGLAIGCAYYGWNKVMGKDIPCPDTKSVFFGRSYAGEEIEKALVHSEQKDSYSWRYTGNYEEEAAQLLADGKVIGWYQGEAEFGPRALGHRSILADPRRRDVQLHINSKIKFREDFRPFAPAVLQEDVQLYFRHGWDSPYMILIDEIKEAWRDKVPGIVHVDGTCRVQTVDPSWNGSFHRLLQCFKEKTGIGMLVNTSFNRRGMPIVETPSEALDFFCSCALDALVIGSYVVRKNNDSRL